MFNLHVNFILVCYIGFIIPVSQNSLVLGKLTQKLLNDMISAKYCKQRFDRELLIENTAEGCVKLIYYKLSGKLGTSCDRADFCRVLPYMECSLTQSRRCVCMSGYQAVSGQCKGEHLHVIEIFCVYSWLLA